MLEFKKYNAENTSYRFSIELFSSLKLSSDFGKTQREKLFIEDICKRVQKRATVLYLLRDKEETFGFISLSVSSIDTFPSLQIDYIFVSASVVKAQKSGSNLRQISAKLVQQSSYF